MGLLHFYRKPAPSETKKKNLLSIVRQRVSPDINDIETEHCFNIEATAPLTTEELNILRWLLAETHNFPSGVAPFPGAETGTGGRIRDVQATGRGAHVIAGTAAYCVGNLRIPGYKLPWEDESFEYPNNLA